MPKHQRKARIKLLTLFLLFIALGMGTVALGNLPNQPQPSPKIQSPPSGTYFDHVVFIMMENEGLQNICGGNPPPCNGSNTPFMSGLATNYTVAKQYTSVYRPITSQPNYVAIIGGSTFTCPSNCSNINAPTLIDRLQVAGLTWKGYFENMGQSTGCVTGGSSPYNSSHNPFIAFKEFVNSGVSNATMCNKLVLANPSGCGSTVDCTLVNDLNNATGQAPNFLWLTPNDCNNMHAASGCANGCTSGGSATCLQKGDSYLKSLVPNILNSQTFKNTRSALFITFDEGQDFCPFNGSSSEDCVYASWSGPVAKTGFVAPSSHLYNHYNFTHTVEVNWNLATLTTHDAGSGPMTEFFSNQPPNFTINSIPSTIMFPTGGSGNSTITLQSTSNFTGTVTLTKSSKPSAGITLTLNPTSVTLTAGGTKTSILTASSSTLGTYNVTVTGTSGSLVHNATLTVSVTPPPDFQISTNPTTLTLGQVSTGASNPVTVTPTGDQTVFESSYLANSFYAKGLYWLFYEDSRVNCEHQGGCLEYTTSFNGSSWATPATVPVHITDSDFSVTTDGSNIYYVRYNDTTFENLCGRNLQFRQGALSTSGSVTWQPEQTIIHASSTRLYANTYITLDSNNQAWVGYVTDQHGACGGNGNDTPQVVHSSGTNYASWTGFFNLTLANSGNWHVALASIGSGQVYASYWITNTDVHGRLYNGSWQSDEQISSSNTLADVNSWLFNGGTNLYMIYFDNRTETYNYASRSSTGVWTDYTIGHGETHTGTKAFNTNYYSLPDAASYNSAANVFDLFYMNSTTHKVDEWTGSAGNWTKTTGIITTGTVPYADSITSFIQSTTQTNGAIFYVSGSSSPFNLNEATLTFSANGSTGNFQTIITSLYGFTGTVTLTTTISPSTGLTVTCNPSTITGGSGTSLCTVNSSTGGNYTVTVKGTSGTLNHSATVNVTVPGPGPDFTIAASVPAPANTGTSTTTTITVTAVSGFTGIVTLTDTVPIGLVCGTITPNIIVGSGTATVTCHSAAAGNYTLTITGTSGSLVHSANATFRIQDFTINATSTITADAGSNGTGTVTLTAVNGFGGTISLTDTGPTGLTCGTITPNSVTGSGTATIACNSNTAGNYTLTITGTSASLVHTTTTVFIIQNFTITATSPSAVDATQSAISTVSITSQNHFAGVVTLTDSIPTGLTCGAITPGTVIGSGTATVSCSATIAGNYTITITSKNGQLVHNATATFRYQDYSIAVNTPTIVDVGVSSALTISISALNHFAGTVTLSDLVPLGLTCGAISPATITGSGTATVSCTASLAGNYNLSVTGTSSPLSHSASATFSFVDFSISAVSPVPGNAKSSLSTTITVSSLNGFASTVALTDQVPSGLSCGAITPTSISGGSGTATISCSANIAGNYTLTITGTSSPLSHSTSVVFQVQDFTISIVNPGPVVVNSPGNTTITITALNKFTGTVSLTDTMPSGLTCAPIKPSTITGAGNASLVCSAYTSGNYTLTMMGAANGLSHTVTETVQIVDFSITAPSQIAQPVGNNSTTTLTLTGLNGFTGNVTLSVGVQTIATLSFGGATQRSPLKLAPPSTSPIVYLTPSSLILSGSKQSNLTIILSSTVPAGNYLIVITAIGPGISRTVQTTLAATDFTINSSDNNPTIFIGANTTLTLTLQSLNGYQGSLTLTWTVVPSGPNATITPTIVYLTSASTTSSITIFVPSNTPAGNYTLTVQATSGALTHTLTITITVPASGMTWIDSRTLTSNSLLALGAIGSICALAILPLRNTTASRHRKKATANRRSTHAVHPRSETRKPIPIVFAPLWTTSNVDHLDRCHDESF